MKIAKVVMNYEATYAIVPPKMHWLLDQERIYLGRDDQSRSTLYASASTFVHKEAALHKYLQKSLEKMLCLGVVGDGSVSFHPQGAIEMLGLSTSDKSV